MVPLRYPTAYDLELDDALMSGIDEWGFSVQPCTKASDVGSIAMTKAMCLFAAMAEPESG